MQDEHRVPGSGERARPGTPPPDTPSSDTAPLDTAPLDTVSAGAPPATVGAWLARELGDESWLDCAVVPVGDGRSNLTFRVDSGAGAVVLRRPPLGSVAATAHDMGREQRVLNALAGSAVPVPRVLASETGDAVLGAPFYVMELVEGIVPPGHGGTAWLDTGSDRHAAGRAAVDVLAELHSIVPDSVGLSEFGRPDGFMARQVRRWSTQWETWREAFGSVGEDRPELTRLAARLSASVPDPRFVAIVHGDYRLENLMFDTHSPTRVRAVLDWEMSTLGDPLADLGLLLVYWHQDEETRVWRAAQYLPSTSARPGFPSRADVVARYAERTGRDADHLAEQLRFYVGFGAFKLSVVLAGVVARARSGASDARTGEGLQGVLDPLVALGHHVLNDGL